MLLEMNPIDFCKARWHILAVLSKLWYIGDMHMIMQFRIKILNVVIDDKRPLRDDNDIIPNNVVVSD